MIYIMKFLGIILELLLKYKEEERDEQTKAEYSAARSNPRDFFDDGVLNNSDTKQESSTIPKTNSPRQPE